MSAATLRVGHDLIYNNSRSKSRFGIGAGYWSGTKSWCRSSSKSVSRSRTSSKRGHKSWSIIKLNFGTDTKGG
jgi:hypothetical protein